MAGAGAAPGPEALGWGVAGWQAEGGVRGKGVTQAPRKPRRTDEKGGGGVQGS